MKYLALVLILCGCEARVEMQDSPKFVEQPAHAFSYCSKDLARSAGFYAMRCENDEVICYVISQGLSCKFKN